MSLRIGIEDGSEGRTVAWVLDHPGCFSYGINHQEALRNLPAALKEFNEWLTQHEQHHLAIPADQEIHIEDTWEVYHIDEYYELVPDGYEVNAWFRHDWIPLTENDIESGTALLSISRRDLLSTVHGLDQEALDFKLLGERWSIAGILNHVGGAEWWYQDRLGLAFPRQEVPSEPKERLKKVRAHLNHILPTLVGSKQVIGIEGEFWSPRKVLRRAIWHERDHTFHIRKLLTR